MNFRPLLAFVILPSALAWSGEIGAAGEVNLVRRHGARKKGINLGAEVDVTEVAKEKGEENGGDEAEEVGAAGEVNLVRRHGARKEGINLGAAGESAEVAEEQGIKEKGEDSDGDEANEEDEASQQKKEGEERSHLQEEGQGGKAGWGRRRRRKGLLSSIFGLVDGIVGGILGSIFGYGKPVVDNWCQTCGISEALSQDAFNTKLTKECMDPDNPDPAWCDDCFTTAYNDCADAADELKRLGQLNMVDECANLGETCLHDAALVLCIGEQACGNPNICHSWKCEHCETYQSECTGSLLSNTSETTATVMRRAKNGGDEMKQRGRKSAKVTQTEKSLTQMSAPDTLAAVQHRANLGNTNASSALESGVSTGIKDSDRLDDMLTDKCTG